MLFSFNTTLLSYYVVRQTDRLTDQHRSIQCHSQFRRYCSGLGYGWP